MHALPDIQWSGAVAVQTLDRQICDHGRHEARRDFRANLGTAHGKVRGDPAEGLSKFCSREQNGDFVSVFIMCPLDETVTPTEVANPLKAT